MLVVFQDNETPRIDDNPSGINNLILNKSYEVYGIEDRDGQSMIVLLNEDMKLGRYAEFRFEVIDDSPIKSLRTEFNKMITKMRGAWKRSPESK